MTGAELIQYEKQITSILKVSLSSEETKVYKAAHKLLRSVSILFYNNKNKDLIPADIKYFSTVLST